MKVQTLKKLQEKVSLESQTNFSIGIELVPNLPNAATFSNETLYKEYADTINNFTAVELFNYESDGYSRIKLFKGSEQKRFALPDNSTFAVNYTIMEQD